jgi:ERF superfamily.
MELNKLSTETAVDLIELVNSLKGFEKSAEVKYKTKTGKEMSFKYTPLDDIIEVVKSNGNFAFLQPLGTDVENRPSVKCILIHKSGEVIQSDYYPFLYKEDISSQDKGAVITYMKRYALASFLGISSETDNDGKLLDTEQEDEEKEKQQAMEKEKAILQKKITDTFNKLIAKFGTNEEVYKVIEMDRELFLKEYADNPKQLLGVLSNHA